MVTMKNKAIQPAITVSIVLFRPDMAALERLLCSIQPALKGNSSGYALAFSAEVVLIDHSDASLSAECLARLRTQTDHALAIRYFHTKANPGFGAGHNRAFEDVSSSRYFLVTNPDLEFLPGSLACAVQYLDSNPDIGLLAPALCELPAPLRPACFRYPDLLTLLSRLIGGALAAKRSYRYECRDWEPTTLRANPRLVSGCCMFFRSTTYQSLGGFDTGFFLYFEDFDLSMRAAKITHSVYHPGVGVKHAGGGAGRKGWRHALMFLCSARRFFAKHGWRWV
jgi:GT2 family glycosyltransferase